MHFVSSMLSVLCWTTTVVSFLLFLQHDYISLLPLLLYGWVQLFGKHSSRTSRYTQYFMQDRVLLDTTICHNAGGQSFFLARSTFPWVLHVGIIVYLHHQSLNINESIRKSEQTAWAPMNSTSWASNSSNQSTDSSVGLINLTHRTTEGTFLIAEPLARRGLLLPERNAWQRCLSCWRTGHVNKTCI